MVAEKILGNIQDKPQKKAIIPVAFEWFELEKKRIKKTAEDGTEFGISIPEVLKEGDILGETESALYVVQIIKTRLIHIHVHKMQEMGRLGFELGNRHLSLKITEQDVYVPYDEPTFSYLAKLGFEVEEVGKAMELARAVPVTLGKRILRTETAGLFVLSVLSYLMEP